MSVSGSPKPVVIEIVAQDHVTPAMTSIAHAAQDTQRKGEAATQAIQRGADQAAAAAERTATSWTKVAKVFEKDLTLALQGAQQGFATIASGIQSVGDRAGKLDTIGRAFENMTKGLEGGGTRLVAELKKASGGVMDELDIMRQANTALLLMGEDSAASLPKLFEIAKASAKATGEDVGFLTDSLIKGIARGSPMILDNLGITVKLGEAHEKYATALGKTSEELSATEKQQALLNAVMDFGDNLLAKVGDTTQSLGERMAATRAFIVDMEDSLLALAPAGDSGLGSMLGTLGAVSDGLSQASGVLLSLNGLMQLGGPAAVAWGAAIAGAAAVAVAAAEELADSLKDLPSFLEQLKVAAGDTYPAIARYIEEASKASKGFGEEVLRQLPVIGALYRAQESGAEALDLLGKGLTIAATGLEVYNAKAGIGASVTANMLGQTTALSGMFSTLAAGLRELGSKDNLKEVIKGASDGLKEVAKLEKAELKESEAAHKAYAKAVEEAQRTQVRAQKQALRDVEEARKLTTRAMIDDLKAEQDVWAQRIRDTEQYVDSVNKAWDGFSDQQREFNTDFSADTKFLGERLGEAGDNVSKQREIVKAFAEAWGMDLPEAIKISAEALKGYRTESQITGEELDKQRKSLEEYTSWLEGQAEQAQSTFELKRRLAFGDDFKVSDFGADAMAKVVAEQVDKATPDSLRPQKGKPARQRTSLDFFGGDGGAAPFIDPAVLDGARSQFDQLQAQIEELQFSLQKHPAQVDAISVAYDEAGQSLQRDTEAMYDSTLALEDQAIAVTETLKPLADAREQFDLAGKSIADVARSMGRLGSAGTDIGEGLDGAAKAITDFGAAITADTGLVDALGDMAQAFLDVGDEVEAFAGYWTGISTSVLALVAALGDGPLSLGAAINSIGLKFESSLASDSFKAFKLFFTDASNNATTFSNNLKLDIPAALNVAAANFALFVANPSVIAMASTMTGLGSSAVSFSTSLSTATQPSGGLALFAQQIETIGGSATAADTAIKSLAGISGTSPIDALTLKLSGFTPQAFIQKIQDIIAKLGELGNSTTQSGATYNTANAMEAIRLKIGDTNTPGSIMYALNSMLIGTGGVVGQLPLVKDAFVSWAGAAGTLKNDLGTMATNVGTLNTKLKELVVGRTQQNSRLSYPDSREMGVAQGTETWNYMHWIMDPGSNYESKNKIRERFGDDMASAALSLADWWEDFGPDRARGAGAPSLAPAAPSHARRAPAAAQAGGGGGSSISITMHVHNPVLMHNRAVADLSRRISVDLGNQLRAQPYMARAAGGS